MATSPRDFPDCAATASAPDALSHLDEQGHARMVEVGSKSESQRLAVATGRVYLQATTLSRILAGELPKGDVLQVARIAGITAVKRTADLIPLCHPLRITGVKLHFTPHLAAATAADNASATAEESTFLHIRAEVRAFDRTGVEMEALTAVSVAALTLYDMCKAIDRGMRISDVQLEEKQGGRSGHWQRQDL